MEKEEVKDNVDRKGIKPIIEYVSMGGNHGRK
jgi:hypothetical protein